MKVHELLSESYDEGEKKERVLPKRVGDKVIFDSWEDIHHFLDEAKFVDQHRLSSKDEGREVYVKRHKSQWYFQKAKIDKVYMGKAYDYVREWDEVRFDLAFADGEKLTNCKANVFNNDVIDADEFDKVLEANIKHHRNDKALEAMDPEVASKIAREYERYQRDFGSGDKERMVACSVHANRQFVVLTVTSTPKDKGNIKHGNRMEIWYLPLEDGTVKRHNGAFSVQPRVGRKWLHDGVETISMDDMKKEIKKAYELVRTKDEDAYNQYFKQQ